MTSLHRYIRNIFQVLIIHKHLFDFILLLILISMIPILIQRTNRVNLIHNRDTLWNCNRLIKMEMLINLLLCWTVSESMLIGRKFLGWIIQDILSTIWTNRVVEANKNNFLSQSKFQFLISKAHQKCKLLRIPQNLHLALTTASAQRDSMNSSKNFTNQTSKLQYSTPISNRDSTTLQQDSLPCTETCRNNSEIRMWGLLIRDIIIDKVEL